jgi:IclR family transcriptional regulator, pca regulon regulatory protein
VSGTDTLQSLARGLAVMRSLGASHAGLTISEVAAQAGISRAGARRILLTLAELRYVKQDGRRFFLTPEVLNLGIRLFGSAPFWGVAEDAVKDLCGQINETVSVGVLDGTDVVYVLRHNPPRLLNLGIQAGFRLPAYASSMGWVLLSALLPWQLDDYLQRARIDPLTPHTITDAERLRRLIAEAAREAFAYVEGTVEEGIAGLSVPIRDRMRHTIAAINISSRVGPDHRARAIKEFLPKLREAAGLIEQQIGSLPLFSTNLR